MDDLQRAALAIADGDKARARQLLKPILKENPSAEAWYLAAQTMDDDAKAITCLKKALALDEWHTQANRMLLKLERIESIITRGAPTHDKAPDSTPSQPAPVAPLPELKRERRQMAFERRKAQQKQRRRFGCIMILLLNMSCSVFSLGLIGVIPGAVGLVTQVLGGPAPVSEIEGTPIRDVPFAAATVVPSQSKNAAPRNVDVMDHGYNHEYLFDAQIGDEVAIYVQFMSLSADNVQENVLVIDPSGRVVIADDVCRFYGEDGLLGGEANVTGTCLINMNGAWRIRILGVEGESIGAYFVGVENLNALN